MTRPRPYGSIAAAKAAGLSLRRLYYWVKVMRVVTPRMRPHGTRVFRAFAPQDVERLKAVKRLLAQGYTLQAAARKVRQGPRRGAR